MTISSLTAFSGFTEQAPLSPSYFNAKMAEAFININQVNSSLSGPQSSVSSFGWFNVKEYGAVGDGATDDSAAILAAIAAVPQTTTNAQGGRVFLPTGNYAIGSVITLDKSGLVFGGDVGGQSTRGQATLTALTAGMTMLRYKVAAGDKGAHVENLKLDGNNKASVALEVGSNGLRSYTARDVTIVNAVTGMLTGFNCQSGIFENIWQSSCSTGLSIGTDNRHQVWRDGSFSGTNWGVVIGGDTAAAADVASLNGFEDCEFYSASNSTVGAVLVRNSRSAYFNGCWAEMGASNASANVSSIVQFGTSNSTAVQPTWNGGQLTGNNNSNFAFEFVNVSRPIILNPLCISSNTNSIGNTQVRTNGIVVGVPSIDNPRGLNLYSSDDSTLVNALSFNSDPRVGLAWSGVSTMRMSAGTLDLATAGARLSIRTIAGGASAISFNTSTDEVCFQINASGASLAIRSNGTTYYFGSSLSTK